MIIAITGGTGFIGRKLVMHHLAQGHEVRILSRRAPDGVFNSVQWFRGDVLTSMDLQFFVEGADVLYHCAGETREEARMKEVHIEGAQRLIQAAAGRVRRWVQLSSVGAYGKQREGVVTEYTELNPCGTYEITKVEADALVRSAALGGAFEHAILRPSNVYGADMSNLSLYGLIEMVRRGWFFFIGKEGASANYIHVDNVVEALVLCGMKSDANGQIYNLSDHRVMEQFVATIADSLGKTIPRLRLPEWPIRVSAKMLAGVSKFPLTAARVDALTGRAIYSNEKIQRELSFQNVVSMEAGLVELTNSWLSRIR